MDGPTDDEVLALDPDLIKMLASDTRREILRLLDERRMTLTELSEKVDLRKATVLEHLKKLQGAGLIERQDDERLWVYYELSHRGQRLISPRRTRFYLILATVIAATAVIVAAALFAAQTLDIGPGAGDDGVTRDALAVNLQDGHAVAGEPVTLDATLEGRDTADVRAFLLSAEGADAIRSGVPPEQVPGVPLGVEFRTEAAFAAPAMEAAMNDSGSAAEAGAGADADGAADADQTMVSDGEARDDEASTAQRVGGDAESAGDEPMFAGPRPVVLRAHASLPPGTYFLYVRAADGSDNRDQLVPVQVTSLEAHITPERYWRGLSAPVTVEVSQAGVPANGELILVPDGPPSPATTGVSVRVVDGAATLQPSVLDPLPAGLYSVRLLADDGSRPVPLDAWLDIRRPQVAVTPTHVLEGQALEIGVHVLTDTDTVEAPALVRANGTVVSDADATVTGQGVLHVPAQAPGTLEVQVGRTFTTSVEVHPHVVVRLAVDAGPELELTALRPDGRAAANHGVLVDGQPMGFTDAAGQLDMPMPPAGPHTLSIATPRGTIDRALHVEGWNVTERLPEVRVNVTHFEAGTGSLGLTVHLAELSSAEDPITVLARLDDVPAAVASPPASPGDEAVLTLEIDGSQGGEHRLQVEALALDRGGIAFTNRTAAASPPGPNGTAPTGGDGADGADVAMESPVPGATARVGSSPETQVTVEPDAKLAARKQAARLAAEDARARLDELNEGTRFAGDDALSAQETPAVAPMLVVLALVGGAAVAARRRWGPGR